MLLLKLFYCWWRFWNIVWLVRGQWRLLTILPFASTTCCFSGIHHKLHIIHLMRLHTCPASSAKSPCLESSWVVYIYIHSFDWFSGFDRPMYSWWWRSMPYKCDSFTFTQVAKTKILNVGWCSYAIQLHIYRSMHARMHAHTHTHTHTHTSKQVGQILTKVTTESHPSGARTYCIINKWDQKLPKNATESCTIDKNLKNFFVRPRMGLWLYWTILLHVFQKVAEDF